MKLWLWDEPLGLFIPEKSIAAELVSPCEVDWVAFCDQCCVNEHVLSLMLLFLLKNMFSEPDKDMFAELDKTLVIIVGLNFVCKPLSGKH